MVEVEKLKCDFKNIWFLYKYSHLSNNRVGWNKHVVVQKLQN